MQDQTQVNETQQESASRSSPKRGTKANANRFRGYIAFAAVTFGDLTDHDAVMFWSSEGDRAAAREAIRLCVSDYHDRNTYREGSPIPFGVIGVGDVEILRLLSFPKEMPVEFVRRSRYDSRWDFSRI